MPKGTDLAARKQRRDDARLLMAGLLITGAIIGGMMLEANTVTVTASLAAILIGLASPSLGLVILALMGPLRAPLVIPPPGFDAVLAVAIIFGSLFRLPVVRPTLRAPTGLVLFAAFVLYAFVQQLPQMAAGYGTKEAHDIGYLFYQLATALATVIAAAFVIRGRSPYPFVSALLLSTLFAATLAIVTAGGAPSSRLANLIPPSDVSDRATGPFGNPNDFGQLLAYGIALGLGWITFVRSRWSRVGLVAVLAVLLYALSLSLSRGALVSMLAGVVALAFSRSRRAGLVTLGTAVALGLVVYPIFVQWRLTNENGVANQLAYAQLAASDGGRFETVLAAPALLMLSPIFGIGFGQYKYFTSLVTEGHITLVGHNWYGTVLAEQGLLGLSMWLLMIGSVAKWLRSRPWMPRRVGVPVLAAGVAGSFFLQPPTQFQLAVVQAIVLTAALVGDWSAGRDGSTETDMGATRVVVQTRLPRMVRWGRLPVVPQHSLATTDAPT